MVFDKSWQWSIDEDQLLKKNQKNILCHKESNSCSNQLLTDIDRSWIITHMQNRRRERKSLQDYLRKNHEIFTLQYTLNVKRNEIERLENYLREEERLLIKSEKNIAEDLVLFDQFLDISNRNASDAASRADEESRRKEELLNEIKQLQKILITYHNDQNHLIDTLKQSRRYQQFLFKFAPENYSLYFTKPEQLLDIFTEMEEKSLPLVQKSQYTCETLDKIHSTINLTTNEQNSQVEQLQIKITQLENLIKHEIEHETSCQNLLIQYKNEKDHSSIEQLKQTIEILYKKYIISDDIGISTIHMLQTIENKIKSLFNTIEHMDSSILIEAEKFREITVRTLEREEKLQQEKLINELKHKKTLLRSSAPPYRKIGRIIMERSRPLLEKKYHLKHSIINKQEQLMR
ncbi:unnamed protein product, partial [Adineta steineri]